MQDMLSQQMPSHIEQNFKTVDSAPSVTPVDPSSGSPSLSQEDWGTSDTDTSHYEEAGHTVSGYEALLDDTRSNLREASKPEISSDKLVAFRSHDELRESTSEEEEVNDLMCPSSDDCSVAQAVAVPCSQEEETASDDGSPTSDRGQESSGAEVLHRKSSGDVEEGEVSDSSGEVSRVNSQEVRM